MNSSQIQTFDHIKTFIGQELGVSDWFQITQERVNAFADCTDDPQWIHVDSERAQRESPFGTTIAHGFLTLSLLPKLASPFVVERMGATRSLNYGIDKVRFIEPVRVGARIRARVKLHAADEKNGDSLLITTENTVEIEGRERPALIAMTLMLVAR